MKNYYDSEKSLDASELVKQPVNELSQKLIRDTNKKIILYGPRGSGRTLVLHNLEQRSLGSLNPAIFTTFDSDSLFGEENNRFDEQFMVHYYEVMMVNKILCFIENNYEILFAQSFREEKKVIAVLINEINDYVKNVRYDNSYLVKKYPFGSLTSLLLEKFRSSTAIEGITLIMDRFDWTDAGSAVSQILLSEYFRLFDKSIITTDDELLRDNHVARERMDQYSFTEVNYGKNMEVIKRIMDLRVKSFNPNYPITRPFSAEELPGEIIQKLVEKANGDIGLMFMVIAEMERYFEGNHECLEKSTNFVMNVMDLSFTRKLNSHEKKKSMSKPIKLYLN